MCYLCDTSKCKEDAMLTTTLQFLGFSFNFQVSRNVARLSLDSIEQAHAKDTRISSVYVQLGFSQTGKVGEHYRTINSLGILYGSASTKGILTICKWPRHLIFLNLVKSGITNKMAKVSITWI